MKKGRIIALIVAALLIVSGIVLLVLGLSFAGDGTRESKLIRQEVTVKGNFDSIYIDAADCDVNFAMFSGRDDCMVEIWEHEQVHHSVVVEDGTLKIKMNDERKWTDYVSIYNVFGMSETMEITMYLPESQYETLRVVTATGDIELPKEFTFTAAELFSDTGEIDIAATVTERITSSTTTGDISIHGSAPAALSLESDTGDIDVGDASGGGDFYIKTDTGNIDAEKVTCNILTCKSSTGDIELERVIVTEYLQAFNDTGDVVIMDSDAGELNIETSTGDIYGVLLSSKIFWGHSDTGKMEVPDSTEGGQCRVQSSTGNIEFFYKNITPN